jgi:hypothetical protein
MVSEALDGHPLVLSTAAGFMKERRMSPREYLEVYNKTRSELLEYSPRHLSMSTVFAESIERISRPPAKLLFSMCCMLSLEAIPLWIFEEGSAPFSSKSKSDTYKYLLSNPVADICL